VTRKLGRQRVLAGEEIERDRCRSHLVLPGADHGAARSGAHRDLGPPGCELDLDGLLDATPLDFDLLLPAEVALGLDGDPMGTGCELKGIERGLPGLGAVDLHECPDGRGGHEIEPAGELDHDEREILIRVVRNLDPGLDGVVALPFSAEAVLAGPKQHAISEAQLQQGSR
jgi:hypothetical protein